MKEGWLIRPRSFSADPVFRPGKISEREAFWYMVEAAAYAPHVQWFNGIPVPVARGEFATSYRALAAAFGWDVKGVRLFLPRVERAGKVLLRRARGGAHAPTIVTVCDYEQFQALPKRKGTPEGTPEDPRGAHEGHTTEPQVTSGDSREERKKAPPSPALPYQEAVEAWEQVASQHPAWKPKKPTLGNGKRRRNLGTILKEHGLDGWRAGLARASRSEWLGGHDPPGWWNFDFITRPDKFLCTLDGNYDRKFDSTGSQRPSGWGAAYHATRNQEGAR